MITYKCYICKEKIEDMDYDQYCNFCGKMVCDECSHVYKTEIKTKKYWMRIDPFSEKFRWESVFDYVICKKCFKKNPKYINKERDDFYNQIFSIIVNDRQMEPPINF